MLGECSHIRRSGHSQLVRCVLEAANSSRTRQTSAIEARNVLATIRPRVWRLAALKSSLAARSGVQKVVDYSSDRQNAAVYRYMRDGSTEVTDSVGRKDPRQAVDLVPMCALKGANLVETTSFLMKTGNYAVSVTIHGKSAR